MKNIYKVEQCEGDDSGGLKASPIVENMIHNFSKLLAQSEEDWWTEQVVSVLEHKGFEVLRGPLELAEYVEAIKKYLKENELPEMTKTAFLADLEEVEGLVK